ncbi:MAG: c-type cytochrome [Hyphomicrobiaceae bacterium]|nr:c-type cytochrome [Hyphomicrobiaceae bacterium]
MIRTVTRVSIAFLCTSALPLVASADDKGQVAFNTHCRNCHSIEKGENRLGPSLFGIVDAEAGAVAGYANYSGALQGFRWDAATLDKFIADPKSVSLNTTMVFPPVADAEQRAAIVGYLKASSGQ